MKKTTESGIFSYQKLEKEYAKFVQKEHVVTCNTGTAALHLALLAFGIKKGDEVIVPDFAMAAIGFAVSYTGAKVVTVDCKDDLNINERLIEKKITKKTKAIIAVHTYGRLCNMKAIGKIAKKHGLFVLEDACEAQGIPASEFADITAYSFYKNKIVHAEEGGAVCTNVAEFADYCRYLKNMAFDENHTYFHETIGFNYRMSDAQAKLALESLKEVKKNMRKRRLIEKWYDENLDCGRKIQRDAVWVYDCVGNPDNVIENVPGSRHFFSPLSTMPMWKQEVGQRALTISKKGFYLPVHPSMSKKDVVKIANMVKSLV